MLVGGRAGVVGRRETCDLAQLYCHYGNYSDYQPIIAKYLSTAEQVVLFVIVTGTQSTQSDRQSLGYPHLVLRTSIRA